MNPTLRNRATHRAARLATRLAAGPKAMARLFADDVRRVFSNVVSLICVIGLVAIPSLFAWFNIAASWDPFGNVRNLKFAVASLDEGYQSDLIPLKVSVGDQVIDALRANSQLDWTITSRKDALEGTKSGEYYAAIVIPKDFSRTMMTFLSDGGEHAKLDYYRNEKLSALDAELTGQGADGVTDQINQEFMATLTDAALGIANSLSKAASGPEAQRILGNFTAQVGDFAAQLKDAATLLTTYRSITDSAGALLDGADRLLDASDSSMDALNKQLKTSDTGVSDMQSALQTASSTLNDALKTSANGFATMGDDLDKLAAQADGNVSAAQDSLRATATTITDAAKPYQAIADDLTALRDKLPDLATVLDPQIAALNRVIDRINAAATKLSTAADQLGQDRDAAKATLTQVGELTQGAKDDIGAIRTDFKNTVSPQITSVATSVGDALTVLDDGGTQLKNTLSGLTDTSGTLGEGLDGLRDTLTSIATKLNEAGDKLAAFQTSMASALETGDMAAVRGLLDADASEVSAALAAPVTLERRAVFPVENFGSTMAPYYTFIPLWTASLLIAMVVDTAVSRRRRRTLAAGIAGLESRGGEAPELRPRHVFLGHFGIFALISLMQSTVSCAGSLLFLRVQAVHPWLFMLSGWVGGLLFALFAYTLVISFGNVGKAIGMLLLVFQVSGSAGSYPAEVLPGFMQWLGPFLPITHAIRAMRAAIAGVWQGDYWHELGTLLLFVPPLLLLGLLLRKPMVAFNRWFEAQLERTKLIA